MKTQISLAIDKPCSEKFQNFKKTNAGGFCNSCSKEVVDFTKMSSNEIIAYLKKNQSFTCGVFNKTQLSNTLEKETQKNKWQFSALASVGFSILSLFSVDAILAQKKQNNIEIKQVKTPITVKGIVSEKSDPLHGVNILLQGTNIGTETDFDGKFTFPIILKKGDVLIFSYLGFETKKVTIDAKNGLQKVTLDVKFELDSCILMGAVAVKKIYTSKKKS